MTEANFRGYPVNIDFDGIHIDVRVNFDADYKMEGFAERHNHHAYEVHFIARGNGVLWIEDQRIPLKNRSLYLLSPKVYHKFSIEESEQIERYSMQFDFQFSKKSAGDPLKDEIMQIMRIMDAGHYLTAEDRYDNFGLVRTIYNELTDRKIAYAQNVDLLVKEIRINLFRTIH